MSEEMQEWGNSFYLERIEELEEEVNELKLDLDMYRDYFQQRTLECYKLEKALDNACELLEEHVLEKRIFVGEYCEFDFLKPIRTKEEWKEYLLNEVNEDVD